MSIRRFLIPTLCLALAGCPSDDPTDDDDATDDDDDAADDWATVLAAASWADGLTLNQAGDTLTFSGDGVPDHDVLPAYALFDGSTIAVSSYSLSIEIPTNPVLAAETTETNTGDIGIAISGGTYFSPYEGDDTSVALDNNFEVGGVPFLDACSGHPLPTGSNYHYHGIPYCITDEVDTAGSHSVIIGVLLDGFPVYGPQGEGGTEPADLDGCSGHTGPTPEVPAGMYHYHLTDNSPYSIPCYSGEVTIQGGGPPGPM